MKVSAPSASELRVLIPKAVSFLESLVAKVGPPRSSSARLTVTQCRVRLRLVAPPVNLSARR